MTGIHRQAAIRMPRPFILGPIAVQFDAIVVRIAQVYGFTNAMIGGAVQIDARFDDAFKSLGQCSPVWVEDRRVIQTRRAGCGRRATQALPRIQSDVMMISACREKCRPFAQSLNDIEAEHAVIEADGPLQIRDL